MEVKEIVSMYRSYEAAKGATTKRWSVTRSLYNGEFWKHFREVTKKYTLTPDTNYIEYVATAYINSIYSGEYRPEIRATDLTKVDQADILNAYIETAWQPMGMKLKYIQWGENVVLYNMQPVKVYLENEAGKEKQVKFETINPFSFYSDPAVSDIHEGSAVFVKKEVNVYNLLKDERFRDGTLKYLEENKKEIFKAEELSNADLESHTTTGNTVVSLIEYYVRTKEGIDNGFIINGKHRIHETKNIKPNRYPFEVLYFRTPTDGPYGRSLISKIENSYIALNILDSIDATHPYLMQNRPKLFDIRSRINARSFKDYGNSPDATFPLVGDPSKAVFYADIKPLPDSTNIKIRLENGIFNMTGVDPAYKGRQTNSIITTGGVQQQQARVVMLTDNSPLVALEAFIERLTKLWIDFHIEHIKEKKLNRTVKIEKEDGQWIAEQAKIEFSKMNIDNYNFILESLPYVPMTKETLFEQLLKIYQYQGQYKFQIPLVTEDDLLEELPISPVKKAKMKQRISSEKQATGANERRKTLLTFASLFQELQNAGFSGEEAAEEALGIMDEEAMMQQNDPSLGMNPENFPGAPGLPME